MKAELPYSGVPPHRVTVEEITDPVSVEGVIEVLDQDAIQLDSKPFYARRVTVPLADGLLVHHATNSRVRTSTTIDDRYVGFLVVGDGSVGSFDGFDLTPERILYVPAGGGSSEFVVGPDYQSMTLLVTPDYLRDNLRVRGRIEEITHLEQRRIWRPPAAVTKRHYSLGAQIVDVATREPSRFNDSEQTRIGAYIDILESLFETLSFISEVDLEREERTRHAYSNIVKTCEAYALEKGSDRLYVTELCELAHISERTLQYAFHTVLGMTPTAYLNRLRMHRVRRELIEASYTSAKVSDVALNWGFWHFGDFAKLYKATFAESPSATLRQSSSAIDTG